MPYQWNGTDVDPSPASPGGLQMTIMDACDGSLTQQGGRYQAWRYTQLSRAQYNSLRTQFGLSDTVFHASGTAMVKANNDSYVSITAIIKHVPGEMGKRGFAFPEDVEFLVVEVL